MTNHRQVILVIPIFAVFLLFIHVCIYINKLAIQHNVLLHQESCTIELSWVVFTDSFLFNEWTNRTDTHSHIITQYSLFLFSLTTFHFLDHRLHITGNNCTTCICMISNLHTRCFYSIIVWIESREPIYLAKILLFPPSTSLCVCLSSFHHAYVEGNPSFVGRGTFTSLQFQEDGCNFSRM